LIPFARTLAISQMILQTNLILPGRYFILCKIIITGSQRIDAFNEIQKGMNGFHAGIGHKILRSILDKFPGSKDPCKLFVFYAKPRKSLIVLKQSIVSGTVLLN